MWNADKGVFLSSFSGHGSAVICGDFTPDGNLYTCSELVSIIGSNCILPMIITKICLIILRCVQ